MSWPGKIACSALVLGAVAAMWPHEPPTESEPAAPASAVTASAEPDTTRFEPSWWETDEARCPEGARMFGGAPPDAAEVWCVGEDGKRHGQHIGWWPDGRKAFERHYRAGVLHGEVTEWNPDGSVLRASEYRDGVRLDRTPRAAAGGPVIVSDRAASSDARP